MISKEKLLEELEQWKRDITGDSPAEVAARTWIQIFIDRVTTMPVEDVPTQRSENKWIPVSERLPENEEEVEISCVRRYIGAGNEKKERHLTARAFYSDGTMTTEDSDFVWNDIDNWEYDEEKDAYIIPEGWCEYVTFSEEFGVVDAEVIAWRPLSEPYKGERK